MRRARRVNEQKRARDKNCYSNHTQIKETYCISGTMGASECMTSTLGVLLMRR